MNELLKKYLKGDPVIWIVFMFLCLISAVEMFSASSSLAHRSASYTAPVLSHVMFLGIGFILVLITQNIHYKYFRMFNYVLLFVAVATLIFTLFQGVAVAGARRWLDVGFIQFQPSELAKIALVIFCADMLARNQQKNGNTDKAFIPIVIALVVFCGLIFTQNFSTAALIFLVGTLMMIIGRVSWRKLFAMFGVVFVIASTLFVIGWQIPQSSLPGALQRLPTQANRIITFISSGDSENEARFIITDANRQTVNSKIAIANGANVIIPRPGSSIQRDYLPEAYSDFIYAIIIEEMGLVGGIFVIALYLILLYRAGAITINSTQVFPALLVIGLTLMIVIQAFASMAVATNLGPVTGLPLPLISRGGTSILVTCIYFGMILSVSRTIQEGKLEESTALKT